MIIFVWSIYIILSLAISLIARKISKNIYMKRFVFSIVFSVLVSFWFTFPGSNNFSPIISIFVMDIFENQNVEFLRLFRPFLMIFIITFLFDSLIKIKN